MRYILAALLLASCAHPPPLAPVAQETPVITPTPSPSVRGALFRLYTADDPPDGDYLAAILAASDDWNEATGRQVFAWYEGQPVRLAQYGSIQREELPPNHITGAVAFPGLVVFSGLVPLETRYSVAAHELGHVIGLSHSTDPNDLMFPSTRKGSAITPNDAARALAVLTESDPL